MFPSNRLLIWSFSRDPENSSPYSGAIQARQICQLRTKRHGRSTVSGPDQGPGLCPSRQGRKRPRGSTGQPTPSKLLTIAYLMLRTGALEPFSDQGNIGPFRPSGLRRTSSISEASQRLKNWDPQPICVQRNSYAVRAGDQFFSNRFHSQKSLAFFHNMVNTKKEESVSVGIALGTAHHPLPPVSEQSY